MKRTPIVYALLGAAGAGALGVLIGAGAQPTRERPTPMFEYGEFMAIGESAYFVRDDRVTRLDPPETTPASRLIGDGKTQLKFDVKLHHLNRLGEEGWEFVTAVSLKDQVSYLMRRRAR